MAPAIVQTETAAAGDLVLGVGGGAGVLALVKFESEEFFEADIDSPSHVRPVELVSENKSVATAIVQTETVAAGDLVLMASAPGPGDPPDGPRGEPPGGAGALALVEL